jgi:hypothetical protein
MDRHKKLRDPRMHFATTAEAVSHALKAFGCPVEVRVIQDYIDDSGGRPGRRGEVYSIVQKYPTRLLPGYRVTIDKTGPTPVIRCIRLKKKSAKDLAAKFMRLKKKSDKALAAEFMKK